MHKKLRLRKAVSAIIIIAMMMTVFSMPAFAGDKGPAINGSVGKAVRDSIAAAPTATEAPLTAAPDNGRQDMGARTEVAINLAGNTLTAPANVIVGQAATFTATGQNAALSGTPANGTIAYFPYCLDAVATDEDKYTYGNFKGADGSSSISSKKGPYTTQVTFASPKTAAVTVTYWKYQWNGYWDMVDMNDYVQTFRIAVKGAVNFNANGGSPSSVGYAANGAGYPVPATSPTRKTFKFDGWFTQAVGGSKVSSSIGVFYPTDSSGYKTDDSVTVYAHWAKAVKATFSLANGKFSAAQKKKYKSNKKTVTTSRKYGTLPTPTRSGYRFFGWWSGSARIDKNSYVTKTASHKLTAKWLKKGKGTSVLTSEFNILKNNINTLNKTDNTGYLMTLTDVRTVIGGKGSKAFSYTTYDGLKVTVYSWKVAIKNTKSPMYIHFVDGKYMVAYNTNKSYRW